MIRVKSQLCQLVHNKKIQINFLKDLTVVFECLPASPKVEEFSLKIVRSVQYFMYRKCFSVYASGKLHCNHDVAGSLFIMNRY